MTPAIIRIPIQPAKGKDEWYRKVPPTTQGGPHEEALEPLVRAKLFTLASPINIDFLDRETRVRLVIFGNRLHEATASINHYRFLKKQEKPLKRLTKNLADSDSLTERQEGYLESLNNKCREWLYELLALAEELRP